MVLLTTWGEPIIIDEHHRLKVEFGRLFRECLRVIDEYQMRKPTDIRRKPFTFLLAEITEMSKQTGKMSQQNAFLLAETTEMSKQTGKMSQQNAFLLAETTEMSKQTG